MKLLDLGTFYVIADGEVYPYNGEYEFTYTEAVKAAEEAIDEDYYEDIYIVKKDFAVEKLVKANLIPA